jgi:hypothetical protein
MEHARLVTSSVPLVLERRIISATVVLTIMLQALDTISLTILALRHVLTATIQITSRKFAGVVILGVKLASQTRSVQDAFLGLTNLTMENAPTSLVLILNTEPLHPPWHAMNVMILALLVKACLNSTV